MSHLVGLADHQSHLLYVSWLTNKILENTKAERSIMGINVSCVFIGFLGSCFPPIILNSQPSHLHLLLSSRIT